MCGLLPALTAGWLRADVTLASPFRDYAVLQRDKPIPIWGRADRDESVQVRFAGRVAHAVAGSDGNWRVELDALPASGRPADLVVQGRNTIVVRDVVVGDVWLCSGQSNMAWTVARSARAQAEIASGNHPLIRQFKAVLCVADSPRDVVDGNWAVASPETVGEFTAVGYFFARQLHQTLGVPIGILNVSQGGSPIEAWIPAETLAEAPAFRAVATRWQATLDAYPKAKPAYEIRLAEWEADARAAKVAGRPFKRAKPLPPPGPGSVHTPSSLYQGMLHPLIPYGIRGALWYQGESNSARAHEYPALFTAMVGAWRERFGQGDFPFYWVQLPNYANPYDPTGVAWAWLREAQARPLALPATGMAVTIDTATDPDEIHPQNKQPVGHRLALLAEARTYGRAVVHRGPGFVAARRTGVGFHVEFDLGDGGPLVAPGDKPHGFELAGPDRVFHPANARLVDDRTVIVAADKVPDPVALRYAWHNNPDATLAAKSGLPVAPFRTDDWPPPTTKRKP